MLATKIRFARLTIFALLLAGLAVWLAWPALVAVEFMKRTIFGRTDVMFDELDKMGEFMMIRLCEYANELGCANADYVIRHGQVREEIQRYLLETQPDLLVLGRPQRDQDHEAPPAFESEGIVRFAEELSQKTGVRVELV
jgi:hypothetical protein